MEENLDIKKDGLKDCMEDNITTLSQMQQSTRNTKNNVLNKGIENDKENLK